MKISIQRHELVRCLSHACDVVDRKAPHYIASCALLRATNNALEITATDLLASVRVQASVISASPGAVGVPAKDLLERLKAMPDTTVEVTLKDEKLIVKGGKRVYSVRTYPAAEFPKFPERSDDAISSDVQAVVLAELLNRTGHTLGLDPNTAGHGMLLIVEGGKARAVTTANNGVASVTLPGATGDVGRIMVPARTVTLLRGMVDRAEEGASVQIARSGARLFCSSAGVEVVSQVLDDRFPPVDDLVFFEKDGAPSFTCDKSTLVAATKGAALASPPANMGVAFESVGGVLRLRAKAEDGEASDEIDAECDGETSLYADSRMMLNALAACPGDRVRVTSADELAVVFIRPADGETWAGEIRLMFMPLRADFVLAKRSKK